MGSNRQRVAWWRAPPGFVRIRWDWETFFGDTMIYGGTSAADVWDLLPDNLRRRFDQVASGMRRVMTDLGEGADNFGLIHDCGFGYWLYDIAVALWELRYRNDYEDFRSALIEGYTRHRRCRPAPSPISMTSSQPAKSQSACGSPAPRRSTPSSAPTSTKCRKTSATRWTPSSGTEATPC